MICPITVSLASYSSGLKDDGTSAGLRITDQLLRDLAGLRGNGNILPPPSMVVQKRSLRGFDVAVVEVEPSPRPPVRFKGRTWIQVGPRRAIATPDEERHLAEKRIASDLTFDLRPIKEASLADLDLGMFEREYLPNAVAPDVLAQNNRDLELQLKSLRFLSRDGVPNTAALLVLGRDPRAFFPGAYVQFLRLDGRKLTDPIRDAKEVSGPLMDVVRRLEEILRANISTSVHITSGSVEERRPDYPLVALQQIFRNAVVHRNYEDTNAPCRVTWFEDRIEIYSPGGLYGAVTPANIDQGVTDYRNPMLAEAMKVLGFVQRFGVGLPLAREHLKKNGNPPLRFRFEPTGVLATIRRRRR